jgi:lipid-binding SYLF domain-containing protein
MKTFAAFLFTALLAAQFAFAAPARAQAEQQELIDKAIITIEKMTTRPDLQALLREYIPKAKGIFIIPALIKGGFILAGEGGSGVLLTQGKSGQWSYPAFYTMGAASIGLQIGGQVSEMIMLILTAKGLTSIIENKVKIGIELNAAVGPQGVGVEGAISTALGPDILAYSMSKGAFIGGAIEGAIIEQQDGLNYSYYDDTTATPQAILFQGKFRNPKADRLRRVLAEVR